MRAFATLCSALSEHRIHAVLGTGAATCELVTLVLHGHIGSGQLGADPGLGSHVTGSFSHRFKRARVKAVRQALQPFVQLDDLLAAHEVRNRRRLLLRELEPGILQPSQIQHVNLHGVARFRNLTVEDGLTLIDLGNL